MRREAIDFQQLLIAIINRTLQLKALNKCLQIATIKKNKKCKKTICTFALVYFNRYTRYMEGTAKYTMFEIVQSNFPGPCPNPRLDR